MPLHKHKPVSMEIMNRRVYKDTICEVLREVFFALDREEMDKKELKLKVRIAVSMAKAMARKLKAYKAAEAKKVL